MNNKEKIESSNVVPTRWNQKFPENLQKRMYDFRLNAVKLGKLISVDDGTVRNWVKGLNFPKGDCAALLSEVLECSMDWLFKGIGPEPGPPGKKTDHNKPTSYNKVEDHPEQVVDSEKKYDPNGGWKPRLEMQDEDHRILGKAFEIIRSNTIYRAALMANINAFHAAITGNQKLDSALEMIQKLEDRIAALESPPKDKNSCCL